VKNNVISEEVNTVSFLDEGDLESVYTSYKDGKRVFIPAMKAVRECMYTSYKRGRAVFKPYTIK